MVGVETVRRGMLTALALAVVLVVSPVGAARAAQTSVSTAQQQFLAGRYVEAQATLQAALHESPDDAAVYHWLSRTYLELGQDDRAIASAEAAVDRAPKNSEYHRWLGRAYGDKADRTRSFWLARKVKAEFEEAVRLDPANIAARRDALEFYLDAPWIVGGGQEKARDEVRAIADLDPVQGDLARAAYFCADGRSDQAAAAYARVLAMKPAGVEPYFEAASFYERHRNVDGLTAAVAAAARVAPADSRLDYYRGVIAVLSERDLDRAVAPLQAYLSEAPRRDDLPSHASAYVWLGRLYEEVNRPADAVTAYENALRLDPDRRSAREALERLRQVTR
jgi:tetratricopeptide (TPR) repeat protein